LISALVATKQQFLADMLDWYEETVDSPLKPNVVVKSVGSKVAEIRTFFF